MIFEKFIPTLASINVLDPLNQEKKELIDQENGQLINSNPDVISNLVDNIASFSNGGPGMLMDWGAKAITVLFILGIILMIMSIIFKNGQWQKTAQALMLWSFISLLMVRAIPITILSFKSGVDVDDAFTALLASLSQIAIFLGVVGIMLSFLFRFAHKLIDHPEYHRWSKNVLNVSIIMMFFAAVAPFIFNAI